MSWFRLAAATILLVVGVTCTPVDNVVPTPATELLPPEINDAPTLATELMPPPLPKKDEEHEQHQHSRHAPKKVPATLFLINVFAVKNATAEESNDVLHDDVIGEVSEEVSEPLAMFLLVVEDDEEGKPVSLDEVAKDLEEEGFTIEKIAKDGETRVIKVDLGSVEGTVGTLASTKPRAIAAAENEASVEASNDMSPSIERAGKLDKIRRKRHVCLKCKLEELKMRKYGGYGGGGGGCNGGCGGGGGGYYQPQPQPVYQPVLVPIQVQSGGGHHHGGYGGGGGGGYYPQPPPQPAPCQTCGGGGGYGPGYGSGGGGNSYAQASAQASASAQSYG